MLQRIKDRRLGFSRKINIIIKNNSSLMLEKNLPLSNVIKVVKEKAEATTI